MSAAGISRQVLSGIDPDRVYDVLYAGMDTKQTNVSRNRMLLSMKTYHQRKFIKPTNRVAFTELQLQHNTFYRLLKFVALFGLK